ncbi:MAG: hypothetical protein VW802_13020 [Rhodospirillaceae bacterium]|jgi:hypothetical protein
MAEIAETNNVFDALAGRQQQRTSALQNLSGNDDEDRRNERRTNEAGQNDRTENSRRAQQVQQFNATQELSQTDNQNVFSRVIDQNGNEVSGVAEQAQNASQVDQQRAAEETAQRERRVEERRAQEQADRTETRLQERLAQDRIEQSSSDPSLPRGSIVDITA